MITIDGSQGEGGGQMLRSALALAALTGKPFRIEHIRAGRDSPGLKPQHLAGIKAAAQLCNGTVEGAELGSQSVTFYPREIKGGTLQVDIGTAGSITLLLQSILLPALFADKPSRITVIGGTDVDFAMPIDYFTEVLVPQLKPWCEKLEVKVLKRGYLPAGQGSVEVFVKPKVFRSDFTSWDAFITAVRKEIPAFKLHEQGNLVFVRGVSHASKDLERDKVAERQANAAQDALRNVKADLRIRTEYSEPASSGSGITIWAVYSRNTDDIDGISPVRLGADALGRKGFPAETVGRTAARRILDAIASKAPVDMYLADNLVPFLAIAGGSLAAEKITQHTKTNIDLVHLFLGDILTVENTTIRTKPQA